MPSALSAYVDALRHSAKAASLNYDIWWVYKSKEHRPIYFETMNRYPGFFTTSLHAHFVALLVALYTLYETRSDTFNIPQLLKRLKKDGCLPTDVLTEVEELYAEAQPLWKKVNILRNNAFGHRSASMDIEEAFSKAKITPKQLKELIEITKRLLNAMTLAYEGSTHAFNLAATEDTLGVLQSLKEKHE